MYGISQHPNAKDKRMVGKGPASEFEVTTSLVPLLKRALNVAGLRLEYWDSVGMMRWLPGAVPPG